MLFNARHVKSHLKPSGPSSFEQLGDSFPHRLNAWGINAQVRGWINYYGAFYRSELYFLALRINQHLVRWAMQKFKRLRREPLKAWAWVNAARQQNPRLFAHWHLLPLTPNRPAGAG
jgi:hypothetical protein